MRIAVIGAGIVGVTSAHELSADGHEVTVYERHAGVASETSFANAGVIAPGYVTPWAAPGMPLKVLRHLFGQHAPVRFAGANVLAQLPWIWRWWRACRPAVYQANRGRLYQLAHFSSQRLHAMTLALKLEYEQARGVLVLLRNPAVVNYLDGCALSLPCQAPDELPVGLMVWAAALQDDTVLDVSLAIERVLATAGH